MKIEHAILYGLGAVALLVVIIPYVVFVTVKLGAYAYLRGRQLFFERNKPDTYGDVNHGEKPNRGA